MAKGVLLASAARTVTTVSPDQTHNEFIGGHVIINVSAAGTSTLTVTIEGKDPISNLYYTILPGAAITGAGLAPVLKVLPGITVTANVSVSDTLPETWRVNCVKGDASSWTYSVAYSSKAEQRT